MKTIVHPHTRSLINELKQKLNHLSFGIQLSLEFSISQLRVFIRQLKSAVKELLPALYVLLITPIQVFSTIILIVLRPLFILTLPLQVFNLLKQISAATMHIFLFFMRLPLLLLHLYSIFLWLLFPSLKFQSLSIRLFDKLGSLQWISEKKIYFLLFPINHRHLKYHKTYYKEPIPFRMSSCFRVFAANISNKINELMQEQVCSFCATHIIMFRHEPLYKGIYKLTHYKFCPQLYCFTNPVRNFNCTTNSLKKAFSNGVKFQMPCCLTNCQTTKYSNKSKKVTLFN